MSHSDPSLMPECAVDLLLRQLMSKWTAHILWILLKHGERRFGYLRKQLVYVSPKVLTARLRMMEQQAWVTRTVIADMPPKVSYQLTPRGEQIAQVVDRLVQLAPEQKTN